MGSILVSGGIPLQGKVRIQGSKNAALPILAACLLVQGDVYLENCPKIADVHRMIRILKSLGCTVSWEKNGLRVNTDKMDCGKMPTEAVTGMRSSLCLLGALTGRNKEVLMEYPGGCVIGERPIDIHLNALEKMGVDFEEDDKYLHGKADRLSGCEIEFPFPSVGATENIVLAAVCAEGETCIKGAAREPEVVALCEFLKACGAEIKGMGEPEITVTGGTFLRGTAFRIPADRIVAGTYLFASLITKGNVYLEQAPVQHLRAVIDAAQKMGAECQETGEGLFVQGPEIVRCPEFLETEVYPGFPTDLQSMFLVTCCIGEGICKIKENIFENRFRIANDLKTMGADVQVLDSHTAFVRGAESLEGRIVEAKELRGGAALVLAGLTAVGRTYIFGNEYIDRGYENICRDLRELGARITRV